ncbi:MAG: hypothetical protein IJT36_03290 [Alphaproteobacteria bacterium]|nr:hypothetical protein [Alphaproteobacteria bacterium]
MNIYYVVFSYKQSDSVFGRGAMKVKMNKPIRTIQDIYDVADSIKDEGYDNVIIENWKEMEE